LVQRGKMVWMERKGQGDHKVLLARRGFKGYKVLVAPKASKVYLGLGKMVKKVLEVRQGQAGLLGSVDSRAPQAPVAHRGWMEKLGRMG
jgi:hypothetical protein